jgi:hypothetical protein
MKTKNMHRSQIFLSQLSILIFLTVLSHHGFAQGFYWVKTYGGIESDIGRALLIDHEDNVIVVGRFEGLINFNSSSDGYLTSEGHTDIFIQKLNNDGQQLWAKRIGGRSIESADHLYFDHNNNLIIEGAFNRTVDFNLGSGSHELTAENSDDSFLLKLSSDGDFIWVKHLKGRGIVDLFFDEGDNMYAVGGFQNKVAFDVNGELQTFVSNGSKDVYIEKMDSNGNTLWVKYFGNTELEGIRSMKMDSEGNIYCTGVFNGATDFDPSANEFWLETVGEYDIFLLKLNNEGEFVWAKSMGSPIYDLSPKIEIRNDDLIYFTGILGGNTFIHLVDTSGVSIWEKELVGDPSAIDFARINALHVDDHNDLFVTGVMIGEIDFDPSAGTNILSSNSSRDGESDCFIAKYSGSGALAWVQQIGGEIGEDGYDLDMDSKNDLFVLGGFNHSLETASGSFSFSDQTNEHADIFIAKIADGLIDPNPQESGDTEIIISPNPSSDYLEVNFQDKQVNNVDIVIFNPLGQELMKTEISKIENRINVSNFPEGSYVLQLIISPTEKINKKFIIHRK